MTTSKKPKNPDRTTVYIPPSTRFQLLESAARRKIGGGITGAVLMAVEEYIARADRPGETSAAPHKPVTFELKRGKGGK